MTFGRIHLVSPSTGSAFCTAWCLLPHVTRPFPVTQRIALPSLGKICLSSATRAPNALSYPTIPSQLSTQLKRYFYTSLVSILNARRTNSQTTWYSRQSFVSLWEQAIIGTICIFREFPLSLVNTDGGYGLYFSSLIFLCLSKWDFLEWSTRSKQIPSFLVFCAMVI
jgi:hypothetical protein